MRCSNCGWPNEEGATRCVKCNSELRVQDDLEQFGSAMGTTGEGLYFSDEQHCDVCGYPVTQDMTHCPACNALLHAKPGEPPAPLPQEAMPAGFSAQQTVAVPPPVPPVIDQAPAFDPVPPTETVLAPPPAQTLETVSETVAERAPAPAPEPAPSQPTAPAQPAADALDEEDVVTTIPGLPETYMRGVDVTDTINPWADPMGMPMGSEPAFRLEKVAWRQEQPAPEMEFSGEETVLSRDNTDPGNNSITSQGQARIFRKNGQWMIENLSRQNTTLVRVDRETPLQDGDVIVLGNRMFVFHS